MCKNTLLFSHAFEPFNHTKHNTHRDETYSKEYSPTLPDWPSVIHQRTNPQHKVTESSCTQPQPLAKTYHMTWSHFRYE